MLPDMVKVQPGRPLRATKIIGMKETANTQTNITSQWFALSVQPGLEKHTAQALQKRVPGVDEVVVPVETLKKSNRLGQKITVDKLIFPGYAFVRAQLQGPDGSMNTVVYDRVLAVYGVRDFVGSIRNTAEGQATTVSPMTEQEITDIKDYMAKNQEDGGRIENAFKEGDAIRVTAGSFMGLEGCVIRVENEQGKATAVLQVFGRETSVELKTADLEPVTS
jgi:transcriptional antiterminator NusG